mmetsp:Transcript_16372/g.24971  ORF Transcript_16372/g.24971 Transcript_16372/m.24971 type:complete len:366 (-) Transcript_16372:362-1459(-)|eukprot:CAMPEP_0118697744 /NCGR_PEP_ID=MMETSP0800-20121206/14725_1 /TAXON_ID=210618 ORGANISM="Striatella unipunctata, Strain CCMP2910" /NCGR_SAMPLE_ID=MMETSP0800 /ASSEMBLY_ACC=CAM_ASM_000638 /LENGTH=365 /DNA_ID=CAMNT_0006597307 /DNA_START=79 /DNA_END=1176 /DNA_ORIENTATION=+
MTFQIIDLVCSSLTQPPPNNMKLRFAYDKEIPKLISLSKTQSSCDDDVSIEHRDANNNNSLSQMAFRDDASSLYQDVLSEKSDEGSIDSASMFEEGNNRNGCTLFPATPIRKLSQLSSPPPLNRPRYSPPTSGNTEFHLTHADSFDDEELFLPKLESTVNKAGILPLPFYSYEDDHSTVSTNYSTSSEGPVDFGGYDGVFRYEDDTDNAATQTSLSRANEIMDYDNEEECEYGYMTMEEMQEMYYNPTMIFSTESSSQSILSLQDSDLSESEMNELDMIRQHPMIDDEEDTEPAQESEFEVEIIPISPPTHAPFDPSKVKKMLQEQKAYRDALLDVVDENTVMVYEDHDAGDNTTNNKLAFFACW